MRGHVDSNYKTVVLSVTDNVTSLVIGTVTQFTVDVIDQQGAAVISPSGQFISKDPLVISVVPTTGAAQALTLGGWHVVWVDYAGKEWR